MALGKNKSDSLLAIAVVVLVLFGVVMIYSSSIIVGYVRFFDEQFFFKRQLLWAVLGITTMVVASNIDYRLWKKWAVVMLVATFVLLLSVFLFSKGEINGAHRWIYLGGISFQPSELAKLTFTMYLSAWFVSRKDDIGSLQKTFLPFVALCGAISFLVLKQPDLGTLSIILAAAIAVYIVAGITWQQVLLGAGIIAVTLGGILAEPYRRARVLTFLDPSQDASGISYHVNNIAIAIGSGGWFGLGFGASGQKRLFLPEPQTDSIFAVITEELGFVVALILIAVFVFIMYRGYRIAVQAPDMFGRLLAAGITSWFAFQTFINLASMLHIVPLVGVPLPFISYGGTNLIISMAAVGVLLSISRQAQSANESVSTVRAGRPRNRVRV